MKKFISFAALIIAVMAACQKDDIKPSTPGFTETQADCRKCYGTWDLTDTIP